ncbi:MAG: LVIVD repeat-containing protein [Thermoleophilaceae bacterium]
MHLLLAVLALLIVPATASATVFEERVASSGLAAAAGAAIPEPHPLTGEGENFEIVANLPLDTAGGSPAASDIEMHGDYAFIGSYTEGMVIADISNPEAPKRVGVFSCGGGSQYDVQLSNDGNLAVLSSDGTGATCLDEGQSGSMIIDTSDKANPRMVSFIPIQVGTHTQTLDDRTLYVNNYPASYSKLEIFDLTNPVQPTKLSELSFGGEDSVHDSFVDHRPDGKSLLYAASIGYTDVIDVTDPTQPELLQRIQDGAVTISHQAEPNPARDTLVVTDEFAGGGDSPVCGGAPVKAGEGVLPFVGDPTDIGALHFYKLSSDGTIAENGTGDGKLGTFNLPYQLNPTGGCTVHVFWQAPDQNRLVAAWYGRGIHVVDYADPANATSPGYFIPTGANAWAAKPHRGYIFTGDIARGMDVLRYTGEGGNAWPATAGDQDEQRRAYRGVTSEPEQPAPAEPPSGDPPAAEPPANQGGGAQGPADSEPRRIGGASRVVELRVPGKRGKRTLTATFRNRIGAVVSKLRFKARAGRKRTLKLSVAGVPGRYTYVIRVRDHGRVLERGTMRVREGQARFGVAPNRTLVCRIN